MSSPEARAAAHLLDLSGESVLVTGASGNIGQAIARQLSAAGARIVAHYHRNEKSARQLEREIDCEIVSADLSDAAQVTQLLQAAAPSMLVNNAAQQTIANLADTSMDDWRAMQSANLDSAFLMTREVARQWTASESGGAIVNIASIEGIDPAPAHGHYAVSKAGLVMLTRAAAQEFGPSGIRVNAVSPGLIERPGLAEEWPEGLQRWNARAPLRRVGAPKDVADAVLFLLSDAARWISGINLVVDGGMSANSKW